MIQSGGIFGKLLGPLLKTGLSLMKNVMKPLPKSGLIPLGLTHFQPMFQLWRNQVAGFS